MKKIFFILLIWISFTACDSVDENKFLDLYKEILIIRVDEPDTAIANPKVRELFIKHNYSEEKFKDDFQKLFENDSEQSFAKKLDSLRQSIKK
jgi:hypothetical protein